MQSHAIEIIWGLHSRRWCRWGWSECVRLSFTPYNFNKHQIVMAGKMLNWNFSSCILSCEFGRFVCECLVYDVPSALSLWQQCGLDIRQCLYVDISSPPLFTSVSLVVVLSARVRLVRTTRVCSELANSRWDKHENIRNMWVVWQSNQIMIVVVAIVVIYSILFVIAVSHSHTHTQCHFISIDFCCFSLRLDDTETSKFVFIRAKRESAHKSDEIELRTKHTRAWGKGSREDESKNLHRNVKYEALWQMNLMNGFRIVWPILECGAIMYVIENNGKSIPVSER